MYHPLIVNILHYIDEIPSKFRTIYYNIYKKIKSDHQSKPDTLQYEGDSNTPNEWHFGPTRCGKSRNIRERFSDLYIKNASNDWFEGYDGEAVVLIDDFDKYHTRMAYDMKTWSDRYPFRAQLKGSSLFIRPERIMVTSNYRPEEIWSDKQTLDPLYMRFAIYTWFKDGTYVVTRPGDKDHVPNDIVDCKEYCVGCKSKY